MDNRPNLRAIESHENFVILGDDSHGGIDLMFRSLVSAAWFVRTYDIAAKTHLTYPDAHVNFDHTTTITISDYVENFQPLD